MTSKQKDMLKLLYTSLKGINKECDLDENFAL